MAVIAIKDYLSRPLMNRLRDVLQVDFEGNVLNTHQFKQLLATLPLPIVTSG